LRHSCGSDGRGAPCIVLTGLKKTDGSHSRKPEFFRSVPDDRRPGQMLRRLCSSLPSCRLVTLALTWGRVVKARAGEGNTTQTAKVNQGTSGSWCTSATRGSKSMIFYSKVKAVNGSLTPSARMSYCASVSRDAPASAFDRSTDGADISSENGCTFED